MEDFIQFEPDDPRLFYDEWLVTNGLGGYACGSLNGAPMRKYNGLLISALKAPFGRTVMLNYVEEIIVLPNGMEIRLSALQQEKTKLHSQARLSFKQENGLPVWLYTSDHFLLEKRVWMTHGQNTVYIQYQLLNSKEPIHLKWRPYFHFRTSEQAVNANSENEYSIINYKNSFEILSSNFPSLKLHQDNNTTFIIEPNTLEDIFYEIEEKRGYDFIGILKSPGFYLSIINPNEKTAVIASTEEWGVLEAMSYEEARIAEKQRRKSLLKVSRPLSFSKTGAKLVLAADQFIMTPIGREIDMVRLKAMGEEICSIIAGYPWFTDWGRDTMISLEGLTLTTGRPRIASAIIRTFAYYIYNGLIPNMFPDGENQGLYHTADATLWFFHAVNRYVILTGDEDILEFIIPRFENIIKHHIKGTLYNIKMDEDGLLSQGQEGYQLTWMDAKVNDWVVTPRRGKAVEINALWYNALKILEKWTGKTSEIAKLCYESFNKRFWNAEGKYLYDIVDGENGNDPSLRPNQIFSISLDYPVLEEKYWKPVVDNVKNDLLTSYGLRTLSPNHPDFKPFYHGNLLARDAAYHQGTVWPWLIGPFIDAWLKVYPNERDQAKLFLLPLEKHLNENCIGNMSEIFDSGDPFHARGCFAQAWSVAEFLRVYAKLHSAAYEN